MEDMISKKELLNQTGISYGQLYRWKRKNIIPEEWFIKKSVASGQETFFPREKILERIDAIINMKDEVSLDEMAGFFSADVSNELIDVNKLIKVKMISDASIKLYKELYHVEDIENTPSILGVKIIEDYVERGQITLDEAKELIDFIIEHFECIEKMIVRLYRKRGISFVLATEDVKNTYLDASCNEIVGLNIYEMISSIKFQLSM